MEKQLDIVGQAMKDKTGEAGEDIRQAAEAMFDVAANNYTGYLLQSALDMIGSVIQFANDLEHPPE